MLLLLLIFVILCCFIFIVNGTVIVSTHTSPFYNNYTFNCLNAEKVNKRRLKFCGMTHWIAASAFNTSTYSHYYPGNKLSIDVQDQRAHDFYDSMFKSIKNGKRHCRDSVKRLACAMFFPEYGLY